MKYFCYDKSVNKSFNKDSDFIERLDSGMIDFKNVSFHIN